MSRFKKLTKKQKAEYVATVALYPLIYLFAQLGKVCDFFGTKKRQIIASVLSFAMILTMIPVMSLTAFAETASPTSWEELQTAINSGGDIKLTQNIVASSGNANLTVPSTSTVSIDLNGYKIDRNLSSQQGYGSVFYVDGGSLTINDTSIAKTGQITGGNSISYGGGVYVFKGIFTMNGGSIIGNTAAYGGGVYNYMGTFTMNGGNITRNTANYGGGVYIDSTFTMNGGSITGNTADCGGGVCDNGTFNVSGNITIKDNTLTNGIIDNFYLLTGKYITVTGALTGEIGITIQIFTAVSSPITITKASTDPAYTLTEDDAAKLISDEFDYDYVYDSSSKTVQMKVATIVNPNSWDDLQTKISAGGKIRLTKDIEAETNNSYLNVPSGVTVIIDLNGYKINRNLSSAKSYGYVFYIDGGNLTINDTSTAKTGQITGGYNTGYGGGVYNKGTFTMNGGSITGNIADTGGGVYNIGTFTMNSGSITGNTTSIGGGVHNKGTFTMNGGSIKGNAATSNGGGVFTYNTTYNTTTFTMNGGSITGNTANEDGGGVYNNAPFTMNGGSITDNTANNGGGVATCNSTFTMNGGSIKGNTANNKGGGVYNTVNFTMNGGSITGNTVINYGGGVYSSRDINVSGNATIKDNTYLDGTTKCNVYFNNNYNLRYIILTGALTGEIGVSVDATSCPVTFAKASNYTLTDSDVAKLTSDTDGLAFTLSNGVAVATLQSKWEEGTDYSWSGSEKQSDLTIKTLSGLNYLEDLVNNQSCNFNGYTVTLANDITEAYSGNPIAITFDKGFEGTFDGNGHSINLDMSFDETNQYLKCGLFGYNCGTIKNVTVTGSVVNTYAYNQSGAGGIAGENDGTIEKCVSKANITGCHVTGGISGRNNGKILNCYTSGNLVGKGLNNGSGNAYVSGIAGYTYSELDIGISAEIQNCYTTAISTATTLGNQYASGITGGITCGFSIYDSSLTVTVENNYYQNDETAVANTGYENTVGCKVENNVKKTAEQFASGEVCYLLNGSTSEGTLNWFQNIDSGTADTAPVLDSTHGTVYKNETAYSNTENTVIDTWAKLQAAINKGGNIKLTQNIEALSTDSRLTVTSGVTATIDLNGYKINRNLSTTVDLGGVFFIDGGNLTIDDTSSAKSGKITGGKATTYGGGVHLERGTFTMNGGTITGNIATQEGGGIKINEGTFNMNGGSITGNKSDCGGGILGYKGTINISGSANVRYNYDTTGKIKSNIYLYNNNYLTITGALTGEIGVTTEVTPTQITPVAFTKASGNYTLTDSDIEKLKSDTKGLEVVLTNGVAVLQRESVTTWEKLQTAINLGGEIKLTHDIEALPTDGYLTVPRGVTVFIDLNGYKINRKLKTETKDGYVIEVQGNLTVDDLSTAKNGQITGGYNNSNCGGVFICSNSQFTLNGGNIIGNTVGDGYGAGVYIFDSGTFIMTGGNITGNITNSTTKGGGGVFNHEGIFLMSGGNITENKAVNSSGGGVCNLTGTFQITGGTITRNIANEGGGVSDGLGYLIVKGGNITENTANIGGGVYIGGGIYTMNGGNITGNTANDGGGIYNYMGYITMTDGSITENTATNNGGGVYNGKSIKVSGNSTIKCNTLTNSTTKSNIYLTNDNFITVTGALTGEIGLSSESTTYPVKVADGSSYTLTATDLTKLFSDKATLGLALDTDSNTINLEQTTVYSVDITWGSMEFTYGGETWNVENHKWENGSWTCDQDADKLTVTNNGNVDVTATLSYLKIDSAFDVNFKDSDETPISSLSLESSDTKSAYIVVMGIPTDDLDKRQIGTVTVVIN